MKKILIACYIILFTSTAWAQKVDVKKLESTLQKAISSAYLPSVRMWGYDTAARQRMSAQFSGVVVTGDGYILTAAHVTIPGKTYKVMFADGKEAIATALGKIEMAADRAIPDVALMKIITPGKWPFAPMATSSAIKVNEPCLSIAYPETLNQSKPSVRFGRIAVVKNDRGFIQSTCKMEPGDSGGPLFDYLGRVIGIHSAINTDEDSNFEIPVDLYQKYWPALQKQEVYTALPADSQSVKSDNIKEILTIPGLANMPVTAVSLFKKLKLDGTLVEIVSTVDTPNTKIYGTLLNVNGNATYIVSKSSMVGNTPTLITNGNKSVAAKIIARDRPNDLVLLQIAAPASKGVNLSITANNAPVMGRLLITPLQNQQGIVSITGSENFKLTRFWSLGYLGAAIGYSGEPPVLTYVQPNSPAAKSDLQVDDQVIKINDTELKRNEDFGPVMQQYWPGDTLSFKIIRNGTQYTKSVVLGKKQSGAAKHPADMFKGGKSSRRDGFDNVFTHDAALLPEQCGSPVFDIEGNFAGINIARFSRTSTLVMPVDIISEFVSKYISNK